ncbi:MAG: polysaccharide biosynthesis protein [Actinomycetia bacterium]|nr:polysaccharide biosynthesis protein [Actinomycetes bacterium]
MNFRLTRRGIGLVLWDAVATYAAFILATFGTSQGNEIFATTDWVFLFGIVALFNIGASFAFRLYNNLWEYASFREAMQVVYATLIAVVLSSSVHFIAGSRLPFRVYVVAWFILFILTTAARFFFRLRLRNKNRFSMRSPSVNKRRTLIVGAGESGSYTINKMAGGDPAMPGEAVAAVDDDPGKRGVRIHGIKVVGTTDMILDLVGTYAIEQIVVAIPSASPEQRRRIYDICMQTDCRLLTLPNVRDLRMDELEGVRLREVQLSDLISRDEVVLKTRLVSGYLADRTVLITGGGGSIGSELARQVAKVGPRRVIIFDCYENTAYELQRELTAHCSDTDFPVEIGSVRDPERLEELFAQYHPEVVFHAAAHKHVPLMEANPREAVLNNVFGTLHMVRAADRHQVSHFIFISTDKAVNPTSVMGATKRMGETIVQSFATHSQTCFTAVRFGNVLGSNGSVLSFFQQQISDGGPVTITHPEITRYFMTIPEASRLVIQAGGMASGGEIFILEMGEPVKIVDLAHKLIRLSGLRPNEDIEIRYIGLRPGEKLHEELLMSTESTVPTEVEGIMVSNGTPVTCKEVEVKLAALEAAVAASPVEIKAALQAQVPTYQPMGTSQ